MRGYLTELNKKWYLKPKRTDSWPTDISYPLSPNMPQIVRNSDDKRGNWFERHWCVVLPPAYKWEYSITLTPIPSVCASAGLSSVWISKNSIWRNRSLTFQTMRYEVDDTAVSASLKCWTESFQTLICCAYVESKSGPKKHVEYDTSRGSFLFLVDTANVITYFSAGQ